MRGGVNPWPDQAVAILRNGMASGRSYAEITCDLVACGFAHTRNSVIGKAHRLGLAGGGRPVTGTAGPKAPAAHAPRPPAGKPAPIMRPPVPRSVVDGFLSWRRGLKPVAGGVALREAPLDACSWPVAGVRAQLRVCGAAVMKGCSYCATHQREAHQPTRRINTFIADGMVRSRRPAEERETDLCDVLGVAS